MSIFNDLFVLELANNHWGSLDRGLQDHRRLREGRSRQRNPRGHKAAVPRRRLVHPRRPPRPRRFALHQEGRRDRAFLGRAGPDGRAGPRAEARDHGDAVRRGLRRQVRGVRRRDPEDRQFRHPRPDPDREDGLDRQAGHRLQRRIEPRGRGSPGGVLRRARHPLRPEPLRLDLPSKDSELEINQIDFLQSRFPNTVDRLLHPRDDRLVVFGDDRGTPRAPAPSSATSTSRWMACRSRPTAPCPIRRTSGSRPSRRPRKCAARRARPSARRRRRRSAISTSSCAGVYAKRDLPVGHHLTADDVFLAVPLLHGQISVREFIGGERLKAPLTKDAAGEAARDRRPLRQRSRPAAHGREPGHRTWRRPRPTRAIASGWAPPDPANRFAAGSPPTCEWRRTGPRHGRTH